MRYQFLAIMLILSICTQAAPVIPIAKFGKIAVTDFAENIYKIDSSADAVFLYDKGNTYYQGNTNSFFSIIQERLCRIRLLHKQAFSEVATIEIPLYTPQKEPSSDYDKLLLVEAATYNLENGKVETVKVEKNSIFKEVSGNWTTMKFTFPNIKEGSIIEFHYKKISPRFWDMDDWYFQGKYPRLWSEFEIIMPEIFDFSISQQGYQKINLDTTKITNLSYSIVDQNGANASEAYTFSCRAVDRTWGISNIPSLKNENYVSSLQNYIACLNFQLSALKIPNMPVKNYRKSWESVATDLMEDDNFGKELNSTHSFLTDELNNLITKDPIVSAKNIYNYIRDNYSCNKNRGYYQTQSIKQTWKTKKGSVADINLLLVAALRQKGISADPVLIGTREVQRPSETFPMMSRFNYVICKVNISKDKYFVLDASDKHLGFNHLNAECYNGFGRTINTDFPGLIPLSPDNLVEANSTYVNIFNDSIGSNMHGNYISNKGYFNSQEIRENIHNTSQKQYFEQLKKGYSFPMTITNTAIDSLSAFENPIQTRYDFNFESNNEDLVYFNPMLSFNTRENPFKMADRNFPVEMPYKVDESYILRMEIPKGYSVDDLPRPTKVSLNGSDAVFQYLISNKNGMIQLIYKLQFNQATFEPEDYTSLRDFFGLIVKKQNEPVVFKKIKKS